MAYHCKYCDYLTSSTRDYKKHNTCFKHLRIVTSVKKVEDEYQIKLNNEIKYLKIKYNAKIDILYNEIKTLKEQNNSQKQTIKEHKDDQSNIISKLINKNAISSAIAPIQDLLQTVPVSTTNIDTNNIDTNNIDTVNNTTTTTTTTNVTINIPIFGQEKLNMSHKELKQLMSGNQISNILQKLLIRTFEDNLGSIKVTDASRGKFEVYNGIKYTKKAKDCIADNFSKILLPTIHNFAQCMQKEVEEESTNENEDLRMCALQSQISTTLKNDNYKKAFKGMTNHAASRKTDQDFIDIVNSI